jgi:hypothetical protein
MRLLTFADKEGAMVRKSALFVLLATMVAGTASAQVAMLTQVTGDVRISGKDGSRSAVPFLKVNQGDRLALGVSGRIQMVFLASGRQEIWKGAGPIDVGAAEGRSGTLKPETSQVPSIILKQLAKTPAAGQHGKTGMVMLRSLDDLAAEEDLEEEYAKFRAAAAPDDTTPEVFLLTGLLDIGATEKARKVLDDVKAKHAKQPAYSALVEHFSRLIAEAAARKQ